MLLFFLFETATLLFAAGTLSFLVHTVEKLTAFDFAVCILLIKLTLASAIPMTLGFFRQLDTRAIVVSSIILSAMGAWALGQNSASLVQAQLFLHASYAALDPLTGIIILLTLSSLAPLFISNIGRVNEWDTAFSIKYAIDWLKKKTTPYTMDFEYSSYWECRLSVPLLCQREFGDSRALLVFAQLEPLVLFWFATVSIATHLGIPPYLSLLLGWHSIAIQNFWGEACGLTNIKNDIIYNSGILTVVLGALLLFQEQNQISLSNQAVPVIFISLGAAFALTKYSAIALLPAMAVLSIFAAYLSQGYDKAATVIMAFGYAAAAACLLSGHFYLKNWIKFGSPLYPVRITTGVVNLPGIYDLRGTSILETALNRDTRNKTIRHLIGKHEFKGPMMFPLGIAWIGTIVLTAMYASLVPAFALAGDISHINWSTWLVAAISTVSFLAYLGSFGSSSSWGNPGDLFHMNRLHFNKVCHSQP
ncbi:MAG TPA: hypothetical protein VNQ99_09565 [Xanthobacteraceae bacterium]|nr:hypothetical protein [Xanthobacteraceae bacterium]